MATKLRQCPDCGDKNPITHRRCGCGYLYPPVAAAPAPAEERSPGTGLWKALIPGLLVVAVTGGFVLYQSNEIGQVSSVLANGAGKEKPSELEGCIQTYGITLHTSEFYVRERPGVLMPSKKPLPRELSTVIRGMARNTCPKPLRSVEIGLRVKSDDGKKGGGWAEVGPLASGQAKPFERAWMGRVTSYEVTGVR